MFDNGRKTVHTICGSEANVQEYYSSLRKFQKDGMDFEMRDYPECDCPNIDVYCTSAVMEEIAFKLGLTIVTNPVYY